MALQKTIVKMPAERRRALEDLAGELDTTVSELVRLGAIWVINSRAQLIRGHNETRPTGATL